MLNDHAQKRDQYGIPLLRSGILSRDRAERERLGKMIEEARRPHQDINFIYSWLMPQVRAPRLAMRPSLANASITACDAEEEIAYLQETLLFATRERKLLLCAFETLLTQAVADIPDEYFDMPILGKLHDPPQGFLRYTLAKSHTLVDDLGFRCSDWLKNEPASSFEELKQRGALNREALKNHCENGSKPSPWVSLADQPSWMLKRINKACPSDDATSKSARIFLISSAKMKRLGILFERSDLLLSSIGYKPFGTSNPDGVKFVWPNHYLAYCWIPAQCIVATYTLRQFRDCCKAHGVQAEGPGSLESVDPFILLRDDADNPVEQGFEKLML